MNHGARAHERRHHVLVDVLPHLGDEQLRDLLADGRVAAGVRRGQQGGGCRRLDGGAVLEWRKKAPNWKSKNLWMQKYGTLPKTAFMNFPLDPSVILWNPFFPCLMPPTLPTWKKDQNK